MGLETATLKPFTRMNLQDFDGSQLEKACVPCIWHGVGNAFESLKPTYQAFSLKLQEAQEKPNFPGRVLQDLKPDQEKIANEAAKTAFTDKIVNGLQARSIVAGNGP